VTDPRSRSIAAGPNRPVSSDLLRQVRRVEIRTRKLVDSRLSGEYLSSFKGQGIEFAEVRPYLPGDDVRSIDWNVTARLGEPFVKRYVEERELSVLMVVDLSASDRWGTRVRTKAEVVAEVIATIAMSAVRNNDRVGLLVVTDRVEWFLPPRKGRRHVLRLIRDLLALEPVGNGTDLGAAVAYAQRILAHRALVFFFSDFQLGGAWESFGAALSGLRSRHDVVACHLADPREAELPKVGLLRTLDPETGQVVVLDTSSREATRRWREMEGRDRTNARKLFAKLGIDEITLRTDLSPTPALIAFFRRRDRRLHR
jgi:uncharacterized protein (DUF58 family)